MVRRRDSTVSNHAGAAGAFILRDARKSALLRMRIVQCCLAPSRSMSAVHREDHARGVSRPVRRQKRHEVADLARMCGAAERHVLLEFLVAVLVAELVPGPRL